MDSILEVQRQTHEEIERLERGLYELLSRNHGSHEAKVQTEHRASEVLDRIQSRIVALNSAYEDQQTRSTEIQNLSTPAQQNDLSAFYSRLVKVQEHHSKYPDSVPGGYFDVELAALLDEPDPEDEEYEDRECRLLPSEIHWKFCSHVFHVLRRRGLWKVYGPLCQPRRLHQHQKCWEAAWLPSIPGSPPGRTIWTGSSRLKQGGSAVERLHDVHPSPPPKLS